MTARPVLAVLAVEDVARARAFYERAFDWKVTADFPVYVELEAPGGFHVGLYLRAGFGHNTGQMPVPVPAGELAPAELYMRVADVGAATARVQEAGGRLLSAPALRNWGDEVSYLADPDGHVLALARETG